MAILIKASTARARAGKVDTNQYWVGKIAEYINLAVERGEYNVVVSVPEENRPGVDNILLAAGYDVRPYFYGIRVAPAEGVSAKRSFWQKILDFITPRETFDDFVREDILPSAHTFYVHWDKAPDETQSA